MKGINNYFSKLFLLILLAVIISCSLIFGISMYRYVNNIRTVTEQNLKSDADQKAKIYEVNISSLHSLSESIGNDIKFRNYFKGLKEGKKDEEFYQTLKHDLENDMKAYSGLLENAFFVYNDLCYVDGIKGATVGYDFVGHNSEWYSYVLNTKKHFLGALKKSPANDLPVMISAYPILDEDNNLLAVFGLAINLNGFSNTIISNSNNPKENTIIVDFDGKVVAASDTELIYSYNISTELPELYQFIETHDSEITFYRKDGVNYLAAVRKTILGAAIIQSLPVNTYRDPIIISVIISVVLLLALIALMAVVTYFLAKNITKPIYILIDEFNEMSSGNYNEEIPEYLKKRKDEFFVLGNALAEMKKQTSQMILQLNLANEETEASLEEVLATEEEVRKQNELLKLSENQLQISNEYNKAILSVIPDMIYIINREGIITDCTEGTGILPQISKMSFLNKHIKEVVNKEVSFLLYKKIQTALDTGILQCFVHEFTQGARKEIFEFRILSCFEDAVIAIARNVTDQHLHQQQIEYLSYHDHLTGLQNRRFFEEEIKRLDTEESLPLCIIMADVNGLKLVNDSFGHKAGDILLVKFAEVLKMVFPYKNRIFRIGGDEFVILVPNARLDQAENMVKQIKELCEKEKVNALSLSVSLGWETKNKMSEDINIVLKSAEDYMYKKKLFDGPSMRGKTISLIINTLHEKNRREEQHSHRVAELCEKLANVLEMPEHERKEIRSAGLLHDIGKIAIPENILNKPGKLTPEEFEEIKRHPEIGYRILCSANEMTDIAEYVLSHHERWDGSGYPRGLKGNQIPLQARMIAIADAFDAMTSIRSYRNPFTETEAAMEIHQSAGTQLDPDLARLFVQEVIGCRFD